VWIIVTTMPKSNKEYTIMDASLVVLLIVSAPIKYGGKIAFKAFANGTNYIVWSDSLADNKSSMFRVVAEKVGDLVHSRFIQ